MTELMVPVNGGEVWAEDSGDGPPLVLLHPGVGDSRIWDPVLPALTATHRVIRYDARGFGRSPAPSVEFSLYDDLVTVLDYLKLTGTPIVGCSQGGDCALGLAVLQPARVSALVLLCPGVSGYQWPEDPTSTPNMTEPQPKVWKRWPRWACGCGVRRDRRLRSWNSCDRRRRPG